MSVKDHIETKNYGTQKLTPIDRNTDVNFEIPPSEVGFFSKPTYIVCIIVGLGKYLTHPKTCVLDVGKSDFGQ